MNQVWGKPDLTALRNRLIAVVTNLRSDINAGNTRDCQEAVEELSVLFGTRGSDAPANYIVRLRRTGGVAQGDAAHVPHSARGVPAVGEGDDHQPGADHRGDADVHRYGRAAGSLVTLGFLAFFFVYLLRILNVIDKPFKVGKERTDDDVSLFLLTEFVVHAHSGGEAAWHPKTSRCRPKHSSRD